MKQMPEVLFCDNHLLIASKPSGMLTQPDETGRKSFEEVMKEWIKTTYHKPGAVFLHAIHRLDRVASGLLLFARTSKALSRLNELARRQEISREYLVEVEGLIEKERGTLEHHLLHTSHKAEVVSSETKGAKKAILFYECLRCTEKTTVLKVTLKTGRYHQIRAQFAAIHHPVCGDKKYGSLEGGDAISLRCIRISFIHPVTGKNLDIEIT